MERTLHCITEAFCIFVFLIVLCTAPVRAATSMSGFCDAAAQAAADQSGVPVSVLRAISLAETGRRGRGGFQPWPWTVNMEGKGVWFESKDDALAYVYKSYKSGARSFDIGCFQINFKWHGHEFASIEEMFDPTVNALYAAKFLQSLHAETGSWSKAAGAYHSRTPEFAEHYAARFDQFRSGLEGQASAKTTPDRYASGILDIPDIVVAQNESDRAATAHLNRYPLLQAGAPGSLGSLVPLDAIATGRPLVVSAETVVE